MSSGSQKSTAPQIGQGRRMGGLRNNLATFFNRNTPQQTPTLPTTNANPTETRGELERRFKSVAAMLKQLSGVAQQNEYEHFLEPLKQASAALKKDDFATTRRQLDLVEPELKDVLDNYPDAKLAACELIFDDFAKAPPPPNEFSRAIEKRAVELGSRTVFLIDAELSQRDDIKRTRAWYQPDTKDKSYIDNVTTPMKLVLGQVKQVLADPTGVLPEHLKLVTDLIAQLETQRKHYEDKTGITDKDHLEQRKRKATAIKDHQDSLREIAGRLRNLMKSNLGPVADLYETLALTAATNPQGAQAAAKKIASHLGGQNTKPLLKSLFAVQEPGSLNTLELLANEVDSASLDSFVNTLVEVRGQDPQFMDAICGQMIAHDVQNSASQGTCLRGKNSSITIAARYCKESQPGKQFLGATAGQVLNSIKKNKKLPEGDRQKLQQKDIDQHKQICGDAIGLLESTPLPPDTTKICHTLYTEAMKKYNDPQQALELVGGHMMLRVVGPAIISAPDLTPEQRSVAVMQTKLLQNCANGKAFNEVEMQPFNTMIGTPTNPGPEMARMQQFLENAVKEGRHAKAAEHPELCSLSAILANNTARGLLRQYMATIFCEENLDYWVLANSGVPANPQAVYNLHIDPNGNATINIDSGLIEKFQTAAANGSWNTAPWQEAADHVFTLMQNDSLPKFTKAPQYEQALAVLLD